MKIQPCIRFLLPASTMNWKKEDRRAADHDRTVAHWPVKQWACITRRIYRGLRKTRKSKSLAQAIFMPISARSSSPPDLLPLDVIGTMDSNQPKNEFVVRSLIFSNFIWPMRSAGAPASTKRPAREAMQERQVTIGETTYKLPEPFLVLPPESH